MKREGMDMWKKLIAPVVIVILLVVYLLTIGGWFLFSPDPALPFWVRVAGILLPTGASAALIAVLIERIIELKRGQEDDITKY